MDDCIFCKIVKGEIDSEFVYENEDVVCFNDISPAAPLHILIVPKKHYADILDLESDSENGAEVLQAVFSAVGKVAEKTGISKKGFRIINNCGEYGGQTVNHVHFHLLGGKKLNAKLV